LHAKTASRIVSYRHGFVADGVGAHLLDGEAVERVGGRVVEQAECERAVVVLERSDVVVALRQRRAGADLHATTHAPRASQTPPPALFHRTLTIRDLQFKIRKNHEFTNFLKFVQTRNNSFLHISSKHKTITFLLHKTTVLGFIVRVFVSLKI